MTLSDARVLVTGGAGFVGSHLCERLLADGCDVRVVDDLSIGREDWVPDGADLLVGDVADPDVAAEAITADRDIVFHFAADSNAGSGEMDQFRTNTRLTETVVERMDEVGVDRIAFTSSSTVYGEAPRPTPETHTPLEPISVYGASKLAGEALQSVYAHSHDFTVWTVRFANVVGPRLRNAVIPDFIEKLRANPSELEILGDGKQEKSYLHVTDCIDGMLHVVDETAEPVNTFNLGTAECTSVDRIAAIVADEMDVDPRHEYTGGKRGWVGDVPRMRLSIEKLTDLDWEPALSSEAAVRRATRELLEEL